MRHPLQSIQRFRVPIFFSLLALTLILMVIFNVLGSPLMTPEAPFGIISFELAGSVSRSQDVIDSWDHNAQLHAAFSLGLDYLFMVLYSTTIALGCIWAGEVMQANHWPFSRLSVPLAWGQWLAALLDFVENIALVIILFGTAASPWPQLAQWCAIAKFALIFIGMIYIFLGLIAHISKKFG